MKIRTYSLLLFFFILSLFLSACKDSSSSKTTASENIFYVDSDSGNDENNGHTENTAWKSIEKVNSYSFKPGDEILFKRGSIFEGSMEISNSGTETEPIIFDAYGTGDLPVLLGSKEETGWTDEGSNIYSKTISYTPGETGAGIVLEDGSPLMFKKWDTDITTSLGGETGAFTYNPNDLNTSTIYLHCSDSLAPSTHIIEAGYYLIGIHGDGVSSIRIRNLHFKQYSLHGISIKDASYVIIYNCIAEKIGGATLVYNPLPIIYAGNGFEFTLSSMNCGIYDSTAIDIFDSGFSPQVFESNNKLSNIIFQNCTAQKCGFAGIEISVLDYDGSTNETIDDVQILSCNVSECGAGWSGIRYDNNEGHGIRVKADYGSGLLSGVSIEQTTVTNCEGAGIFIAGESGTVSVHRAYISGNKGDGILCQEIDPVTTLKLKLTSSLIFNQNDTALTSGIGYNVVNGNGFDIINNTFVNNNISIAINVCGGSALSKNNIFYSSGFQAYLYTGSTISTVDFEYNCYYEHSSNIINWVGSLYTQISDFYSDILLDQHSIGDNPTFVNSSSDWHLQSGSLCKSTGIPAGVSVDYDGNAFDTSNPSRGAYQ